MTDTGSTPRTIGLAGATGVGLGAIVGGGILVLAGVAFRTTGPGAIAAFAANGLIAVVTALSFAELSTAFPESGGAYTYARKVLSVRVAFAVGWVLWFAYIVAGVLYALGFAEYAVLALSETWRAATGRAPGWLSGRGPVVFLALAATGAYTLSLIRKATGGGQWVTVGKVVVFAILIFAGAWALLGRPPGTVGAGLTPFLPRGGLGLLQAMGFSFIALQGFEVIAAVAGEVRRPERTLPRAMLLSLGVALAIYLPLLLVVSTAGVPAGSSIVELSEADPETVMANAARHYLGPTGFALVVVAALLSTLSALQANILAASRVASSMASDRALPSVLSHTHPTRHTPLVALYATALAIVATLLALPGVAAAGAAASLVFLLSFAMAHWTAYLARKRSGGRRLPFRTPWFPVVPAVGGAACLGLALFQAFAVPSAGAIVAVWLGLGVLLYLSVFARQAQRVDAFEEAASPDLVRLRGRSPLVLVPVANPDSAAALVAVAGALAAPEVGRVLLLSVLARPAALEDLAEAEVHVLSAQAVLGRALASSFATGHLPEALLTVAPTPWAEIARVARTHRCESLLLGLQRLDAPVGEEGTTPLEGLLNEVDCDVGVLRAPAGWSLAEAGRILVPVAGLGGHDELRARLLGSLCRTTPRTLTFMRVLPSAAAAVEEEAARRALTRLASDESPSPPAVELVRSDDVVAAVTEAASAHDLLVLGLPRRRGQTVLGGLALQLVAQVGCSVILLSRRG